MLGVLNGQARLVCLTASLTGLRKSELRGLRWSDWSGKELFVNRSVVESDTNETKTASSKAPIPVIKRLAEALEAHRLTLGVRAAPDLPIFQAGNTKPLNLSNLSRREIRDAVEKCAKCRKSESKHEKETHPYELDKTTEWHGFHAFRRGLATNLHALGVDDKTIQAILRHGNIQMTQDVYIKTVNESQIGAMEALNTELQRRESCNDNATQGLGRIQ